MADKLSETLADKRITLTVNQAIKVGGCVLLVGGYIVQDEVRKYRLHDTVETLEQAQDRRLAEIEALEARIDFSSEQVRTAIGVDIARLQSEIHALSVDLDSRDHMVQDVRLTLAELSTDVRHASARLNKLDERLNNQTPTEGESQ